MPVGVVEGSRQDPAAVATVRHSAAADHRSRRGCGRRGVAGTGGDRRRSTDGLTGLRGLRPGDCSRHVGPALAEGRLSPRAGPRAASPCRRMGAAAAPGAGHPDSGAAGRAPRRDCAAGAEAARRPRGYGGVPARPRSSSLTFHAPRRPSSAGSSARSPPTYGSSRGARWCGSTSTPVPVSVH